MTGFASCNEMAVNWNWCACQISNALYPGSELHLTLVHLPFHCVDEFWELLWDAIELSSILHRPNDNPNTQEPVDVHEYEYIVHRVINLNGHAVF